MNKTKTEPTMTPEKALHLSRLVPSRRLYPEENKRAARVLFDYYKSLLPTSTIPPIPTPRRWL